MSPPRCSRSCAPCEAPITRKGNAPAEGPAMKLRPLLGSLIGLFLVAGCASNTRTVRVAVPPRMDLAAYPMVGLVTFTSNARGELDRLTTQRFMQAVQEAQPGTRVVELGSEQQV